MSDLIDTSKEEKIRKKDERRRERELGDVRKVVSTAEGRRFLWKTLASCGIYRNSFTGNSNTFYNEGQRSIGLLILGELMSADPKVFAQMQQENFSEKKSEEIIRLKEAENV